MPGRTDDERHTAAAAATAARRRRGTTHMCRVRPGPVVNRPVRSPLRPSVRTPRLARPPLSVVGRGRSSSLLFFDLAHTMDNDDDGRARGRATERAPGGRRATATGHHESSDRDRPTDRPANGGEGGKKAKSRPSVSSYGVLRKNLSRPLSMSQPGPHAHAVFQPPARPPLPVFTCE